MKKSPPQPRRQPSQSRSRVLVSAIVQACKQILAQEGVDSLTTNRIAEVAGVTIGSLYQYFPNKEAILASLFTAEMAAQTDQIGREATLRVSAQSQISLRATMRELIRVSAELHVRYLKLHGDFYREYHDFLDFHSQVNTHVTEVYQQPPWDEWLPELLHDYRAEISAQDLQQAAFIIANTIERLLSAALEQEPQWLEDEQYLQQIESMVMGFLQNGENSGDNSGNNPADSSVKS